MSSTRMSIVVRRDLQMPPGLLAAQVLHIGMMFVQSNVKCGHKVENDQDIPGLPAGVAAGFVPQQSEWISQPYVAVLAVDTPEELEFIRLRAAAEKLPIEVWRDVIPSKVLDGQVLECVVGIAIGPADSDQLRKATGTLPLY